MEEELDEVGRIVRRERVDLDGLVVFEAGVGFRLLSGELEFELVVDLVDRVRVRQVDLSVEFARGRAPDEAYEMASPFPVRGRTCRSQSS